MKISEYKSRVSIIHFQARLDASYVNQVREQLKELTRAGNNLFVADLSNVYFVDSQGLGILVSLLRASGSAGGKVLLVKSSTEAVQRLFKITQLDQVFELYNSVEEALESLKLQN